MTAIIEIKRDIQGIIRSQNDIFRNESCLNGICASIPGKVCILANLNDWLRDEDNSQVRCMELLTAIAHFDQFNDDNDPHGEHDLGRVEIQGKEIIWKIDYYDRDYEYLSPNKSDCAVTRRVMMLMFASDY